MKSTTRSSFTVKFLTLALGQDNADEMELLRAKDFAVEVLYSHGPGAPAVLGGPMENAVEAVPDEISILSLLTLDPRTHFEAAPNDEDAAAYLVLHRGFDILPMIDTDKVQAMADNFLATKTWSLESE